VIPAWTGITLEPVHWPTPFTILAWWQFTQVARVTYVCVHGRCTWRRLLLLRQTGTWLDVGIRCRNHVDVGGSGAFSTAGLVGALPFVASQLCEIHYATLFVRDKTDGPSSGHDMVAGRRRRTRTCLAWEQLHDARLRRPHHCKYAELGVERDATILHNCSRSLHGRRIDGDIGDVRVVVVVSAVSW